MAVLPRIVVMRQESGVRINPACREPTVGTENHAVRRGKQKGPPTMGSPSCAPSPAQRATLPAFRHEVQTLRRLAVPLTVARTRWMLGFHRRFVFFLDQGTLWPKPGPLAQTSHTAATGTLPLLDARRCEQAISTRSGGCPIGQPVHNNLPTMTNANPRVRHVIGALNFACRDSGWVSIQWVGGTRSCGVQSHCGFRHSWARKPVNQSGCKKPAELLASVR